MKTTLFTGVKAGYSKEKPASGNHAHAVDTVSKTLSVIKRSGAADTNSYETYPAFVVYDPALNCPEGGELAVAVMTAGSLGSVTATAEQLRARLEQSSLSVAGVPETDAALTKGLRMEVAGDLAAIARLWQEKATEIKNATITDGNPYGIYVSVGVYDTGNGNIVIQGEANPRYFPADAHKEAWQDAAIKVARAVTAALGRQAEPEFRETGFSYLRAKERANSRGENF